MDHLTSLLVVSRALHFAAALLIWGGLVLALVVVDPAAHTSPTTAVDANERVRGFLRTAGWWGLGVSLLSGVAWLLLEAALMSGQPMAEATQGGALWLVLSGTGFGRVWMGRFAMAAALGILMFARAAVRDRSSSRTPSFALALAGGYLASLALVGHAADGQGAERFLRITTDAVHLLAAGAWLGALPGLAVLLASALRASSAASLGLAARAARRFSRLGIASVGALLASGLVNAWYLVGDVPALLGTLYGQLLVAKILLFATMVALAATNRRRLTPQVQDRDASALRTLTRNATLEIVAGIAVVAIVGALGVAIPAVHQSPVWPFGFSLNLAEPAYPTSYARSPVKYTTLAIAHGSAAYAANCVQCHGLHGRGDGPSAASLPIRPVDLVEHAAHHRAGDLFWRIARGIPNTAMPAFSPRLSDEELWTLVQYLRALSESQMARALTIGVEPPLPITAPDFAFEESPHVQETLANLRGGEVLLVVGVLPESLPRLQQLEAQRAELAMAGIRVILMVAIGGALSQDARALPGAPRLAIVDSATTQTYALFACGVATACPSSTPPHVEWLVDRGGHLRARWLWVSGTDVDRTAEIIADARRLQREPSRLPAREDHGH